MAYSYNEVLHSNENKLLHYTTTGMNLTYTVLTERRQDLKICCTITSLLKVQKQAKWYQYIITLLLPMKANKISKMTLVKTLLETVTIK